MGLSKHKQKRKFHHNGMKYTYIVDEYVRDEIRVYEGKNNLLVKIEGVNFFGPDEVKKEAIRLGVIK